MLQYVNLMVGQSSVEKHGERSVRLQLESIHLPLLSALRLKYQLLQFVFRTFVNRHLNHNIGAFYFSRFESYMAKV